MWFCITRCSVRSYVMRSMKLHYRKVYIYDAYFMYSYSKFVYCNNMSPIQFFLIIKYFLYFLFVRYLLKNTTWETIQCFSLSCQLNRQLLRFIHVTANGIFIFKGCMVLCTVIYCCVSHCPFYVLRHHTNVFGR